MGIRVFTMILLILCCVGLLADSACIFGPNRYYAVMGTRGNYVFIRHDRWYEVGKLPEGWKTLKTRVKAASWYNPEFRSTISTEVLCEGSVGDRPVEVVASSVAAAMEDRKTSDHQEFMLDGRGAVRETVAGSVDGVQLVMDVVAVKKDNCAFDFIAVTPPEEMANVQPIFEEFFNGFHFE